MAPGNRPVQRRHEHTHGASHCFGNSGCKLGSSRRAACCPLPTCVACHWRAATERHRSARAPSRDRTRRFTHTALAREHIRVRGPVSRPRSRQERVSIVVRLSTEHTCLEGSARGRGDSPPDRALNGLHADTDCACWPESDRLCLLQPEVVGATRGGVAQIGILYRPFAHLYVGRSVPFERPCGSVLHTS